MKPINLMHAMDGVGDNILLEAETFHAAKQKPDLRSFRLMRVAAAILVLAMLAGLRCRFSGNQPVERRKEPELG